MKVERQGPCECILATFAGLAEIPLDDVRDCAYNILGGPWWATATKQNVLPAIAGLGHHFNAPDVAATVSAGAHIIPNSHPFRRAPRLPKAKRGAILLQLYNPLQSHILPFEGGYVYDPSEVHDQSAETLGQLLRRYRRDYQWSVLRVIYHRPGKLPYVQTV